MLYFISGFLYVVSMWIKDDTMRLFTQPIFIPAIVIYYFMNKRKEVNTSSLRLFTLSLFFCFLGEICFLVDEKNFYLEGLLFFLLPYPILIKFLYEDYLGLIRSERIKLHPILIFLSGVLFFLIVCMFFQIEFVSLGEKILIGLFSFFLFVLLVLCAIHFIYSVYFKNTYLFLAVLALLFSDLFYLMYVRMYDLLIFKMVNCGAQTIFYFFYVKYFLERSCLENDEVASS